ncbi:MAG: protein-L-isoaspartate(D-aspartate) O-methyltransferase [Desulfurococcales archaeon]|nr:protein-L-isoaspartate(D-aspartate) O-methyltransferase [Desulfurococcales archaeon]
MSAEKERLIRLLKEAGFLRSESVERAFRLVPREEFVPEDLRSLAYADRPLPIGFGQTISAPSIVVYMTELLDASRGMKVLEVGTGSGYQAAVLAEIVAPTGAPRTEWGHVWTIEIIEELAERAKRNLERAGYSDRVTVIVGDGSKGYPREAPYHRIMVTAASPDVPRPLVGQLVVGGRMVVPVGDLVSQTLMVVERRPEGIKSKSVLDVVFVPLRGEYGWKNYETRMFT